MLRTKGEAGTGNVVEAVRHARAVQRDIRRLASMDEDELFIAAKEMQAPYDLVKEVARTGKLPVNYFYFIFLNTNLLVIHKTKI